MMVHYSWLVPVFPLVSFGLILLFGMQDSERGGSIALLGASFSSVFSLSIAYDVFINDAVHGSFVESTRVWFSGSTYSFEFGTYIDSLKKYQFIIVRSGKVLQVLNLQYWHFVFLLSHFSQCLVNLLLLYHSF